MNRAQRNVLLIGGTAVALILLFPAWLTRSGQLKIDLGRSWILSPPARLGPEDFQTADVPNSLTEQQRRELRQYLAGIYGEPEIDWVMQGYLLVCVLIVATTLTVACRGRRRPTEKDLRTLAATERAFRTL